MKAGRAIAAAAILCLAPAAACAENLLLALSSQEITIASNYAGSNVTLFGAIRSDARMVGRPGGYDLVVAVRGPAADLVVREKAQIAGVWVNGASKTYRRVPSYLAVLSTRPLAAIAPQATRAGAELGLLDVASSPRIGPGPGAPAEGAAFASALVRLQAAQKLWREDPAGVAFLDQTLFRATIPLPPNVPFGPFEVDVRLFVAGAEIARETITFRVVKAGFEARVAGLAETWRLPYGLGAALLALLFGWAASVMFRRD